MIDYKQLERLLRTMKPRQKAYELVKAEMQRRGHWKYLKRGRHVKKPNAANPKQR